MSFPRAITLSALPAALAIAGCATPFRADVSRFQQMPAPQGQSFTVVAADSQMSNSIEFQTYAQLVSNELTAQGYRMAATPGTADLVVSMDYGVDQGRERIVADADPFWGSPGYWRPGYWGSSFYGPYPYRGWYGRRYIYGFHDPFLFGSGWGPTTVRSYTVYRAGLDLTIDRAADNQPLFEGRAEALSRSNNLTYLVPNLIEAMFTGFPGNSGETVRISVAPPEKQ